MIRRKGSPLPTLLPPITAYSSPSSLQANKLAEKRKAHDEAVRSEKKAKKVRAL